MLVKFNIITFKLCSLKIINTESDLCTYIILFNRYNMLWAFIRRVETETAVPTYATVIESKIKLEKCDN